jgi:hypothetical protein
VKDDLVEEMARAICAAGDAGECDDPDAASPSGNPNWRTWVPEAQACASIARERERVMVEEITPAMFEAGNVAQHPDDCTDVRDIYRAMVRASLPSVVLESRE